MCRTWGSNSGPLACQALASDRATAPGKFHMEPLWDGGTKVCSNGPGQMTKVAAMLIYGKNVKKSSSLEPKIR